MKKLFPIYLLLTLFSVFAGISCNSDDVDIDGESLYVPTSTLIRSFSLQEDDSVLADLDSVHFTIDLAQRVIYNADSLPKGTKINRLLASISVADYASCEVSIAAAETMSDTTFTYSSSSNDSIDFTGIVKLRVVAGDGTSEMTYRVKVNVHQMEADSLYWNKMARQSLPGRSDAISSQKTVKADDTYYCLMIEMGGYTIAGTKSLESADWVKSEVSFGFKPILESFTAVGKSLVILREESGKKYICYSNDGGLSWVETNTEAYALIGAYDDYLLYVVNNSGVYQCNKSKLGESPVSTYVLDDTFPVSGFSPCVVIQSEWLNDTQIMLLGGVDKSGTPTGAVWGFDGSNWGEISRISIPACVNPTLIPYYNFIGDFFGKDQYPVWLAMGGIAEDGKPVKNVYISYDNGVTWKLGDEYLQLPSYINAFSSAQAFVEISTLSRSAGDWISYPSRSLPHWWKVEDAESRASSPVTSWDCPYIYLFGGVSANGGTYNTIWRGVLNRLSFKPVI